MWHTRLGIFVMVVLCAVGCRKEFPTAAHSVRDLRDYMRFKDSQAMGAVLRAQDNQARVQFWNEYRRGGNTSIMIAGSDNEGGFAERMLMAEDKVVTQLFRQTKEGRFPRKGGIHRDPVDWIKLMRREGETWKEVCGEVVETDQDGTYLIRYKTSHGAESAL